MFFIFLNTLLDKPLFMSNGMLNPQFWFLFAYSLFILGLVGLVFNFRNILITLMCMEIIFFGLGLAFIGISISFQEPSGQVFALLLLALAAAESAIGLGLFLVWFRKIGDISIFSLNFVYD